MSDSEFIELIAGARAATATEPYDIVEPIVQPPAMISSESHSMMNLFYRLLPTARLRDCSRSEHIVHASSEGVRCRAEIAVSVIRFCAVPKPS